MGIQILWAYIWEGHIAIVLIIIIVPPFKKKKTEHYIQKKAPWK